METLVRKHWNRAGYCQTTITVKPGAELKHAFFPYWHYLKTASMTFKEEEARETPAAYCISTCRTHARSENQHKDKLVIQRLCSAWHVLAINIQTPDTSPMYERAASIKRRQADIYSSPRVLVNRFTLRAEGRKKKNTHTGVQLHCVRPSFSLTPGKTRNVLKEKPPGALKIH